MLFTALIVSLGHLWLASHVSTPTPAVLEPTFEGRGGVISAQKEFREHIRILEGLKVVNRQSRGLKY